MDNVNLISLIQNLIGDLPVGYEIFYYIIAAFVVCLCFKWFTDCLKILLNIFIKER